MGVSSPILTTRTASDVHLRLNALNMSTGLLDCDPVFLKKAYNTLNYLSPPSRAFYYQRMPSPASLKESGSLTELEVKAMAN
jgi:hypothetical protein